MSEHEEWRPVVGFEGRYEVSNLGGVRTLTGASPRPIYQHAYRNRPTGTLYMQVALWIGMKGYAFKVHRLVLDAFVGTRPAGLVCCHNNGNGCDNRLSNLRWDTPKSNKRDSIEHGTVARGTRHPHAKLNEAAVKRIRDTTQSARSLGRELGVAKQTVLSVRHGRTWAWLAD